VLVVAPSSTAAMVADTGHAFRAGGEPAEEEIALLREQLVEPPPVEAAIVGNGELFGRLATQAMLPEMAHAVAEWCPDLVLREPCEHASTLVAARHGVALAQVAIRSPPGYPGVIPLSSPAGSSRSFEAPLIGEAWPGGLQPAPTALPS
jgi:hypothetical protein